MLRAWLLLAIGCVRAEPPDRCVACNRLVGNLNESRVDSGELLFAALASVVEGGRLEFGGLEQMIEEPVERSCRWASTFHDPKIREACEELLEEHGEDIVEAIARWAMHRAPPSQLLGSICSKAVRACKPSELKPGASLPARGSREAPVEYRSERPPLVNDGPVYIMVAETMTETLASTEHDVFACFLFFDLVAPELKPRFERLAALAAPGKPDGLRFALIDCDRNDPPPPHGVHVTTTTLMAFPAEEDLRPKHLQWLEPDRGLGAVLEQLAELARLPSSKRHLNGLGDRLHARGLLWTSRWWEDDAVLAAAHESAGAPLGPPRPKWDSGPPAPPGWEKLVNAETGELEYHNLEADPHGKARRTKNPIKVHPDPPKKKKRKGKRRAKDEV